MIATVVFAKVALGRSVVVATGIVVFPAGYETVNVGAKVMFEAVMAVLEPALPIVDAGEDVAAVLLTLAYVGPYFAISAKLASGSYSLPTYLSDSTSVVIQYY